MIPERRYLRIVFLDDPVQRAISQVAIPSRRHQLLMTLNNASRSPLFHLFGAEQVSVYTRVKFGCKSLAQMGQF